MQEGERIVGSSGGRGMNVRTISHNNTNNKLIVDYNFNNFKLNYK